MTTGAWDLSAHRRHGGLNPRLQLRARGAVERLEPNGLHGAVKEGGETVDVYVFLKIAVLHSTPLACPDVILGLAPSIYEAFACGLAFGKAVHRADETCKGLGIRSDAQLPIGDPLFRCVTGWPATSRYSSQRCGAPLACRGS